MTSHEKWIKAGNPLPSNQTTRSALLRAFDSLRRQIALRSFPCEGAAAGFVSLEFLEALAPWTAPVVVEGRVLNEGLNWQRVEYRASVEEATDEKPVVIAHAIGQTVALRKGDKRR